MDDSTPWRRWEYAGLRLNVDPDIAADAFQGYRDTLATAITQDDIPQLANSLYSKNIISKNNRDYAVMVGILPSEKMVHLLDASEARIRSNPSDFLTVLDILNSEPVFRIHAERIWEKYWKQEQQERKARLNKKCQELKARFKPILSDDSDTEESAKKDDENNDSDEESAESPKSKLRKKKSILSRMRKGVRKMFGAARDMTSSFIKEALRELNLDVKIFRKYKKRFDKHTNREQVRWWFEIWGDEGALKALELKWEEVSSQNKWRLETCPVPPPQRC